jgi:uncharacterized protein YkwD
MALLSACGGGGGDNSATANSSQSLASPPPVPASAASSAGSFAGSFADGATTLVDQLNALRTKIGVGLVTRDPILDIAAQAHAQYLLENQSSIHDEIAGSPGYYGDTPLARALNAGVPAGTWVGEVEALYRPWQGPTPAEAAQFCFNLWYNSAYHLWALVANEQTVGAGFGADAATSYNACVLDVGTNSNVPPNPVANSVPYAGGRQIAADAIVVIPYRDEAGVQTSFSIGEVPDPTPDLSTPGRPLMVFVNGESANVLAVTSFQLVDSSGSLVPSRILIAAAAKSGSTASAVVDPNKLLSNNVAFLVPLAPLNPGVRYTATFAGSRSGKPAGTSVNTSWSFTTAAAQ